jgi:uncharacterized protein
MILPDTNLLIYAHDQEAPYHVPARAWWLGALKGTESVGIPWIVILAFIRLSTHPGLLRQPLGVRQAREVVDLWLQPAHVRVLHSSDRSLQKTWALLEAVGAGGNLCTDAHIAALALEHGGCVYSNDRDFGRFPDLVWENPLSSAKG